MKKIILVLPLFAILLACNKPDKQEDSPPASTTSTTSTTPTPVSVASITLTSGAKTTTITGSCGWASAAGVKYIGAKDQNNNLRVFEATFNIPNPPTQTTTYTLTTYNINDTNPAHISMSFSEQIGNSLLEWTSSNTSGTMTLVVSGNKITVNLSGITLTAQTNSGFYTNLNTGEYANQGVLSGTLTFYN